MANCSQTTREELASVVARRKPETLVALGRVLEGCSGGGGFRSEVRGLDGDHANTRWR